MTLDDRIGVFDQLGRILEKYLESSTSQEEPVSEGGYSDPDSHIYSTEIFLKMQLMKPAY